jgi:hypothetical protein
MKAFWAAVFLLKTAHQLEIGGQSLPGCDHSLPLHLSERTEAQLHIFLSHRRSEKHNRMHQGAYGRNASQVN